MTTAVEARREIANAMPEKELQANVVKMAKACGWKVYHTWRSDHSVAGFPDLIMLRNGVGLAVELKRENPKNLKRLNPTPEQEDWLLAFEAVTGFTSYTWRPMDWLDGTIERVLAR